MAEMINIKINGKDITCEKGQTILQVAKANGIDIPNMCYSEKVKLYGACGVCVVEAKGVPKLLRSCASFVTDGMEIETETDRVKQARKVALELMLSDHVGDCRPPCAKACPAGTDCQGYVGLIANGKFEDANRLIKDKIPLPASIGRVCPHPCEQKCRRQAIDDPVQIAFLKRFAADKNIAAGDVYVPEIKEATGKKVAIIGGGPAGLSAAYELRRKGHNVTLFDAMPKMGGMLRYGIPEYRLPKAVLDAEVEAIHGMGVEFKNNTKIGTDITIDELKKDYDAVIIAIGFWTSSMMRIPGEELEGCYGGIDFLRKSALGEETRMGARVAVVGGGNTAMDACRTAVRLGAKEVYVFYRRTRAEMPANAIEIEEAEEEGVVFKFLCNPAEILGENGKVVAVKGQVMELGEPDASGRRSPVAVEGKFDIVPVDTVIMAIGQRLNAKGLENYEVTKKGTFVVDAKSFMTADAGVFACGDCAHVGADKIAVAAIGDAIKTANAVDAYLTGRIATFDETGIYPLYSEKNLTMDDVRAAHPDEVPVQKIEMAHDAPEDRKTNFKEYMHGFTDLEAMREAEKCLECGCMDYYECKLINYANRYDAKPERVAGSKHKESIKDLNEFIIRDNAKCMLCGLCVRACEEVTGNTALGLVGRGFDTLVTPEMGLPLEKSKCTACGLCVSLCPTGALYEKAPLKKNVALPEKCEESKCRFCTAACDIKAVKYGKTLLKVLPADNTVNLCNTGRFGFSADGFVFSENCCVECAGKNAAEILEDAVKTAENFDFSKPYAAISSIHTKAEAEAIMNAVKAKFANAKFVYTDKAIDEKTKANIDACLTQNGVSGIDYKLGNKAFFEGGTADGLTVADYNEIKNNATVIISFADDIAKADLGISYIDLPAVFGKI